MSRQVKAELVRLAKNFPPGLKYQIALDTTEVVSDSIREVVLFPMNQKAEDLMMNAPAPVSPRQLKELSIRLVEQG